jgi:hypothetical protein
VAPGRLSTTHGWPSLALTFGPMARAMASVEPPAGNGTTTLIALSGKPAACTLLAIASVMSRDETLVRIVIVSPRCYGVRTQKLWRTPRL